MIEVGSKIRIKETAWPGSDEPLDIANRGKAGEVVLDLALAFNEQWTGCYEVRVDDTGDVVQVLESEIELL